MVLLAALFLSGAWQRSPAAAITSRRAAAATLGVVGASRLVRRRAHVLASEQSQQPRLLLTSAGLTTPKQSGCRQAREADVHFYERATRTALCTFIISQVFAANLEKPPVGGHELHGWSRTASQTVLPVSYPTL